jgi:hypothetical protein
MSNSFKSTHTAAESMSTLRTRWTARFVTSVRHSPAFLAMLSLLVRTGLIETLDY